MKHKLHIFNSDYDFPNGRVVEQAEPWIVWQTNIGWRRFARFTEAVRFVKAGGWS